MNILNLRTIDYSTAHSGGGKFAGLVRVKPLIDKYVAQYSVPLAIPDTYAIPIGTPRTNAYDMAMHAMDACGGNVAVRSSADVEDTSGKTHSGEFESVLNIDTRDKMQDALDTVYASAKNVPGAQMGIVIQRMISNIDMAGVLYSQDFNGDPYNVINYCIGRPSDYLLINQETGTVSKIGKHTDDPRGNFELLNFSDIFSKNPNRLHIQEQIETFKMKMNTVFQYGLENIFRLAALGNHLESDLGYPVDVEFAINKKGTINILQQRPYIIHPDYIVTHAKNGDWIGYNKRTPIITGEIKLVDFIRLRKAALDKMIADGVFKNKILLSRNNKSYGGKILAMWDIYENVLCSKLKIDATYTIHSEMYGHYGNQFRERATPFLSTRRTADFQNVHDGDIMEIDMRTRQFKIIPQKTR